MKGFEEEMLDKRLIGIIEIRREGVFLDKWRLIFKN